MNWSGNSAFWAMAFLAVLLAAGSGDTVWAQAPALDTLAADASGTPVRIHSPFANAVLPSAIRPTPAPRAVARKLWIASIAAVAAASFLDAHSSWGKSEMNPVMAGGQSQFAARGALIKAGVNVGWLVSQIALFRRNRAYHTLAAVNFGAAGLFAASAVHNYGVARP